MYDTTYRHIQHLFLNDTKTQKETSTRYIIDDITAEITQDIEALIDNIKVIDYDDMTDNDKHTFIKDIVELNEILIDMTDRYNETSKIIDDFIQRQKLMTQG